MIDDVVDPAPTTATPLRTRRTDGEWWVSVDDLTTALTLLEMEVCHDEDKAVYAPAFATVRDIVEGVVP